MLARTIAILVLWLATAVGAYAQGSIAVKGTVVDSQGEAIIGASVTIKGNPGMGTVSDFSGVFSMKVPSEKSVLVISYIGMQPKEVRVGKQRSFKVTLQEDRQQLNEVVVVGYGQQKKASIVGAIAQTDAKTLQRTGGVSSLGAALTGNLPGA